MKNIKFILIFQCLGVLFYLSNCKEKPETVDEKLKAITIKLNHTFSDTPLKLFGAYYITSSGDSFQPTTIIYHLNNFTLVDLKGLRHAVADKYFMVDVSNPKSVELDLGKFDESEYHRVEFTIGVEDSITNANGLLNSKFISPMYWGMANGYVNFKVEGNSPQAPQGSVVHHIGGYIEPYKLSRRIAMDLQVHGGVKSKNGNAVVALEVDLSKYFHSINKISLKDTHLIHTPNDAAKRIADNWFGMFSVQSITYK